MFKKFIRYILFYFGYEIRRIEKNKKEAPIAVLYQYLGADGSFDYEKYRRIQDEGNKKKINNIWVIEENIIFLSNYIKSAIGTPQFGICHGTRNGKEQEWFRKHLRCEVIGTEISDTAENFPHTVHWDFHEVKSEWIDATDFIYSNSFDHSYDPEKCLNSWMSCIKKRGVCIIEHSSTHNQCCASELDPFGADITQMPYLITKWGKGKYGVRQLIDAPKKAEGLEYLCFIIIQRF
jgi:hypothetical protein